MIGLGMVVCFHEAGHFIAAKLCGVKVEAFSIGWGPKILSFTKGETEYRLSLLPMGGYCKMKGEEFHDSPENDTQEVPQDTEGSLNAAHPLKKAIIYFAGPFMNLIFSIIALSVIWMSGFSVMSPENRIILASEYHPGEQEFAADRAGLKTGDYVTAVNGREITNFQDMREAIAVKAKDTLEMTILRDGQELHVSIVPELNKSTGAGTIGVYPWIDPVIDQVTQNSSAYIAGLQHGDIIVMAEDQEVRNYMDIVSVLWEKPSKVHLTYLRDGQKMETELILNYNDQGVADPGFSFQVQSYDSPDMNIFQALRKGTTESFKTLAISVKSLKLLFGGVDLSQAVSGPIRITYMMGEITSQGFGVSISEGLISFFQFLSLINIALFFMNLLPIPALDGGGILLCLIELVTRKKIPPKAAFRYQMIGFALLITLMIFTVFNDVIFLLRK
ncbi:MAG: RIP metalloprotease RseP [Spirochaetia bacterium]|nr:RIP metalloprotease RseP [Spirochaetia bacterium]